EVGRDLARVRPIGLYERFVLRRGERGAVLQGRYVADHLVAHEGKRELVVARPAADYRFLVAGRRELLGKLKRHRADHQGEDRVGILLDGRDERAEVDGSERRPDFLDGFAAAVLERFREPADGLVAKGIVGRDHGDAFVTLLARPLPERVHGLRARPAGTYQIGMFVLLSRWVRSSAAGIDGM